MLRDDVGARVARALAERPGEGFLIQLVHQPELCCCGGGGLQAVSCTCSPEIRLHELPDQAGDVIEPVFLRRLMQAQRTEAQQ